MNNAKTEIRCAAIVTVEYPTRAGGLETVTGRIAVPGHLLWSAEGLAEMFTKLREDSLGRPEECEPHVWDCFHIVGIDTSQDLDLLTAQWGDPEPYPHNGHK